MLTENTGACVLTHLAHVHHLALYALDIRHKVGLEHVVAGGTAQKARSFKLGIFHSAHGAYTGALALGLAEKPREHVAVDGVVQRTEHLVIALIAQVIADLFAVVYLYEICRSRPFFTALTEHASSICIVCRVCGGHGGKARRR